MGADDVVERFANAQTSKFKMELAEVVIDALEPIQKEYHKLMDDREYLASIANVGSTRANELANKTLAEVKSIVGLFSGF
jgi:tryptophanyl-tRNA synthetase